MAVRDLEAERLGRVEQAIDVAFELEDAAVVGADALEDAVAVEQAVVEDADRRLPRPAGTRRSHRRGRPVRTPGGVTLGLVSIRHEKSIMPKKPSVKQANR